MKLSEEEKFKLKQEESLKNWGKRSHFLLSTICQRGIYNKPQQGKDDYRELLLRSSKSELVQESIPGFQTIPKKSRVITTGFVDKMSTKPKLQGPFRSPMEVSRWKRTPLYLSLRVESDFFAAEKVQRLEKLYEWAGRLHDKPFHAGRIPTPSHNHLLNTNHSADLVGQERQKQKGGSAANGKQATRQSTPLFKSILPPIPIFDRYNREYVRGYVDT